LSPSSAPPPPAPIGGLAPPPPYPGGAVGLGGLPRTATSPLPLPLPNLKVSTKSLSDAQAKLEKMTKEIEEELERKAPVGEFFGELGRLSGYGVKCVTFVYIL